MSKDIWMYFSLIHTSDLIIQLLEMSHVHATFISNMKNIKGNMQVSKQVSVVNTELSLKV